METDRARWDERWSAQQQAAEPVVAAAPDVVASHAAVLEALPTTGRALDLACGVGAQSLWLAARGLTVTALDVSPVAIEIVDEAAARAGVAVDASVWDTDAGLPAEARDFALIVCQRYRAPDLYGELVDRLQPGGVLVLTVLSAVGLASGDPGPFHAPAGELTSAFAAHVADGSAQILLDEEAHGQASVILRRI